MSSRCSHSYSDQRPADSDRVPWATVLFRMALVAMALTSTVAAYTAAAAGDFASTTFVAASYATLLLLLRRLRAYELLPMPHEAANGRGRLKRDVWALCTLLTVLFAWKVAGELPTSWQVAGVVWAMAILTVFVGFVPLFCYP